MTVMCMACKGSGYVSAGGGCGLALLRRCHCNPGGDITGLDPTVDIKEMREIMKNGAQRLLYDKINETTDVYSFQINSGGPLHVKERGLVEITFKNGKFESVSLPFPVTPGATRNAWRILAAIEEEIGKVEVELTGIDAK